MKKAFADNIFQLNSQFSITPGIRYEFIKTDLSGLISDATLPVSYQGNRNFPLLGTGLQYQSSKATQLYGNISQAYRPYLYANVTPADRIDIVDPSLNDSKGYDIDIGFRGRYKDILQYNINGFYLFYGKKVGQLTLKNQNNTNYLFTTNIGDAVTKGIEAYVSVSFAKLLVPFYSENQFYKFHLFNSFSYNHARYINGQLNRAGVNIDLKNKFVEGVPEWTNRTGLVWQLKTFITLVEFTYVSKSFSDANNTVFNPTGATGIVPAYQVWDWNFNWKFLKHYYLAGGVNNLANKKYFTRRINMYPGPGILPADGRTFYFSIGAKL